MINIILIDDEPANNFLLGHMIRILSPGTSATSFTDPAKALAHLTTPKQIDPETVILLDLNMPIMNGWEFLEKFQPMNIKCVCFIEPAHAGGAYPGQPDELRQTMSRYMDGRSGRRPSHRWRSVCDRGAAREPGGRMAIVSRGLRNAAARAPRTHLRDSGHLALWRAGDGSA